MANPYETDDDVKSARAALLEAETVLAIHGQVLAQAQTARNEIAAVNAADPRVAELDTEISAMVAKVDTQRTEVKVAVNTLRLALDAAGF